MNIKQADRKWVWVSTFLIIALTVYAIFFPPVLKNANAGTEKAVAKVNGVSISTTQFYEAMVASGGEQTLDSLISDELINQEAKKAGIQVTEDDINNEIAAIKKSFATEDEFQQTLTSYGMSLDDLKKNMQTQVVLKKILEPQVTITDEQIKQYYDENLESLKTPEQVQASHISVATKEEADAIAAELKNGGDFAALAKEKSMDTATKDKGGDLGYVTSGSMDSTLETAAFALETGTTSDPVQTANGYDIIRVTDRKAASTPTLDEKKEEIKQTLINQQISTLSSAWLSQKKAESTIENYLTKDA
ncbi:peptidyl-prolyl cis-trans isomerase [Paenibacillus sedimenti]|uniref:peptidylprolyl isomerase n=1 Tax=Paenibacillus sedimenti TaxID=2770274 RepID=A0A926KTQ0_9BACL|nr:peptidyl-prolyl cis-trans isomerase [Paenibacillus sedimenti]MBD0384017.1 peptidyl-prolyl cis-trans isomerase [Paenibacillus sedimenti]